MVSVMDLLDEANRNSPHEYFCTLLQLPISNIHHLYNLNKSLPSWDQPWLIICIVQISPELKWLRLSKSINLPAVETPLCQLFPCTERWYLFIGTYKLMLYLFMFYNIPVSPFSPFSPFLPSLPSLPGIPTFPSAPGGPLRPGLPGRPGDPGTLQIRRGAPFSLVSNSCPKTQWHRQTTPISVHIFKSVNANRRLERI